MSILNYSAKINAVNFDESSALYVILVKYMYDVELDFDNVKNLLIKYYDKASNDVDLYKEEMSKLHNSDVDSLYEDIADILQCSNHGVILFTKSTICRLNDWFLHSDKELEGLQDQLPYVLDNDIQIYKDYSDKFDMFKQHDNNLENINAFLGFKSKLNFRELVSKTDKIFIKLLGTSAAKIRRDIADAKRSNKLYSRTSNKSASFYKNVPITVNSYVENLYSYHSEMLYHDFLTKSRKFDTAKIEGNYDYIVYNIIKNKGMGTRFVFFTNPQVNSFLKPVEDIFKKHIKSIKMIGTYDQDGAIKKTLEVIKSNIDNPVSILCLDSSKYSDTLPVSVIFHVINLIIQDKILTQAICELLNLPVLYKKTGEIVDHNATLQGVYFDFSAITLVNLYIQCAISVYTESDLIWTNVVGDDCITILAGDDHKEKALKGRVVFAHFGLTVKESKAESSNLIEGKITYLKYRAETINKEITNISGLSPGLLLKNVHSYARLGSIIAYLKKSLYLERDDIPEKLLRNYAKVFGEVIFDANTSKIHRLPKEEAEFIRDNVVSLMLERPFVFGGYKYYDISNDQSIEAIADYIEDAIRYIEYNFIDPSETVIPVIMKIKKLYNLDNSPLDEDLNIFISEEFNEMHSKLLAFRMAIKSGKIMTEKDIKDVRSMVTNMTDRRFDKYVPGGLTTDRVTNQPFEDKMLLAPVQKPIDIENLMYLPKSTTIDEKNINILISKWMSVKGAKIRGTNSINPFNGSLFIDIDPNRIITFSGSDSGRYITVDSWINQMKWYEKTNEEQWKKEMGIVFAAILDDIGYSNETIQFISNDPSRLYDLLSILNKSMKNAEFRSAKINEYIQQFKGEFLRDYKSKLLSGLLDKYRNLKV